MCVYVQVHSISAKCQSEESKFLFETEVMLLVKKEKKIESLQLYTKQTQKYIGTMARDL